MARKRTVIDPNDGISAEEVSEAGRVLAEGVTPSQSPLLGERMIGPELFTVGEWKGLPQWRCALCPWDTLVSEAEMRAHIAEVHLPPPEKPPARVLPLVDRFGNPITVDGRR